MSSNTYQVTDETGERIIFEFGDGYLDLAKIEFQETLPRRKLLKRILRNMEKDMKMKLKLKSSPLPQQ